MTFKEYYSLTPRSFFNAINGFRKKEDNLSKERLIIMRKIMYASMKPYLPAGIEEQNILEFSWETKQLEELTLEKAEALRLESERIDSFWKKYDESQIGKA